MALLRAPSKQPKTTTLQVRLEEEVRHNLDRYAEFIDATPSYVVSEALKFLFKKDDEFKRWLDQQASSDNYKQTEGGVHTNKPKEESTPRLHNKHEAPFKPTRRAREYSVFPTACLAPCNRYLFKCDLR